MSYYLSVKLKQIKYSGDNLGRELKFRLKIENQVSEIGFILPHGESRSFDKVIFQKTLKEKPIILPVAAEVREARERHIDFGTSATKFKIQSKEGITQKETLNIVVKGTGREKNKTALIAFTLEVSCESALRYVLDVKSKGWLTVKLENKDVIALPQLLKVEILKIENNREYFIILEGVAKGKKASVRLNEDGKSYLSRKGEHKGPAELFLNQETGKIIILGLGTYNAKVKPDPLPSGKYDIEIPSEPHDAGWRYLKESKYAKTWFRIGHEGSRFLHVGQRSLGCVTVTDKEKWTEIYGHLIKSRKNSKSIGEVIVK